MIKRLVTFGFIPTIIGLLCVCCNTQQTYEFHAIKGSVFGTTYSIKYQGDSTLMDSINSVFQKVDTSLSLFNPESNLRKLNESASDEMMPMTLEVVKLALSVSNATSGAFDVTVAPLTNAWGFGFKTDNQPTKQMVDSLLASVGYRNIQVDGNTLIKKNPDIMLDCGAIAKGFASDKIAEMLKRNAVSNFIVEIGGEIVANGHNEKNRNWKIGIDYPNYAPDFQITKAIVPLKNRAVATSGNYRNYQENGNHRFGHEIDPRTGYPAISDMLSATVFSESCAEADAYATAFMVLGFNETLRILETQPQLKAYLIYEDSGEVKEWSSSGLDVESKF